MRRLFALYVFFLHSVRVRVCVCVYWPSGFVETKKTIYISIHLLIDAYTHARQAKALAYQQPRQPHRPWNRIIIISCPHLHHLEWDTLNKCVLKKAIFSDFNKKCSSMELKFCKTAYITQLYMWNTPKAKKIAIVYLIRFKNHVFWNLCTFLCNFAQ